jgi:uncharacterized protein
LNECSVNNQYLKQVIEKSTLAADIILKSCDMTGKAYNIIYPNPLPPGVTLEKNIYAPIRDGVKIALDVYKPAEGKGPWPAILAYSPFPQERFFESAKPAYYCHHGYVCVQASERGIGLNEGKFIFHGLTAAQDGNDIIEWIA